MKKTATPYFPMGFANFGDNVVCAGLKDGNKIYLAVWNLKVEKELVVPIAENITSAQIAYPTQSSVKLNLSKEDIRLSYPQTPCAAFLELTI